MCGMRVCEWTRRELTPDIRFMGGDYDPGHSGRNREEERQQGQGQRERQEVERTEQRPWNEMRCLISPGQVRSYWRSVWSDEEPMKEWTPAAALGIHYGRNRKRDSCSLWYIYLLVMPPTFLSIPLANEYFHLFSFPSHSEISPKSTLFVQKFPWEALGFTPSLCCIFKCLFSFILIDALSATARYPPADAK